MLAVKGVNSGVESVPQMLGEHLWMDLIQESHVSPQNDVGTLPILFNALRCS